LSTTQTIKSPSTEQKAEPLPEKIAERKIIIYKALDPTVIKIASEKVKDTLFMKYGFLKPSPDQIQQVSFEKDYDAFVVVEGKFSIDYYRIGVHTFQVDEKVREFILFKKTCKPQNSDENNCNSIRIEGEERLIYQSKAYLALSADGKEISPKIIPSGPSEEQKPELLVEIQSTKKLGILPDEEINIIRNKIVKRPSGIKRIASELFEVSDRAVIYAPIYRVKFQNLKTGEMKTVKFDGVTAELLS
jgi:hypothetical protein